MCSSGVIAGDAVGDAPVWHGQPAEESTRREHNVKKGSTKQQSNEECDNDHADTVLYEAGKKSPHSHAIHCTNRTGSGRARNKR